MSKLVMFVMPYATKELTESIQPQLQSLYIWDFDVTCLQPSNQHIRDI